MELDFGTSALVRDCLTNAAVANNPRVFWGRRGLKFAIIFFQVLENARGRFVILSLESFKGKKTRIFISKGSKGKGRKSFAEEISVLLLGLEGAIRISFASEVWKGN
uniref:Uncharacterized protein n=1 Tax=Cucumis sativus TaxID=3659 RepID=A0A0A0KB99_CUCSA